MSTVSPAPATPARNSLQRTHQGLVILGVVGVALFLAIRVFLFIHRYAVNVLFWDQWDFWKGMFEGRNWWDLFVWQHGPHRQGLGYFVIRATAVLSSWDTKTEAFVIGGVFVVSTLLALAIKWQLTRRWSLWDVCIPIIILTVSNFEAYVGTTNPAHGPVPLMLVLAITLAWLIPRQEIRVPLVVVLEVLVVFTGFGMLFGPIVCVLFCLDALGSRRDRRQLAINLIGLFCSAGALLFFFRWHYAFAPAVGCFVFPDPEPVRYPKFLAVIYLRALQLHDLPVLRWKVGVLWGGAQLLVLVWAVWGAFKTLGRSKAHVVVLALSGFSLLFAVNSAIGRVCLGDDAGAGSRYVTYMLCCLLAVYLALQSASLSARLKIAVLSIFLVLLVVREARTARNLKDVRWYTNGKTRWVSCYLRLEDVKACNREANFQIYPEEANVSLASPLAFLKERKLNLFKGPPP